MKKFKYLAALSLPLAAYISFQSTGWLTLITVLVFFVMVPGIELLLKPDKKNLEVQERELAEHDPYFDGMMVMMVPIHLFFCVYFLFTLNPSGPVIDIIGHTSSLALMMGVIGINLGHELGHRNERFMQFLGELMLTTSLENHFLPYHNRSHHLNVATPSDPATSRLGEPLYAFWFRSHFGSYYQAWQNEKSRLTISKKTVISFNNRMVNYTIANVTMLALVYFFFGGFALMCFFIACIGGILLLETVNYIEHYGLLRKQRENGTYERVKRCHSWNSDHVLGRIVLFELSRHSDHHFKADRPYQLLESVEGSPQMPTGYPGMMLLAMIPPLFYKVMKPRVLSARELS